VATLNGDYSGNGAIEVQTGTLLFNARFEVQGIAVKR